MGVPLFKLRNTILNSSFLRQNAVFFVGSLVVSILNYAYYPILGRMLNIEEYGEVQVLISFFLQLTLLMTVFTQVTVAIVANYEDEEQKHRVIFELEKFAFLVGAVVLVIGILLSGVARTALKFDSVWPFILLLLAFLSTIPFTFRSAFLRGKQKFLTVSVGNIIASLGKIIGSVAFILLGFGVSGAIGGLIAAQLIAFIFVAAKARAHAFKRAPGVSYFSWPDLRVLRPELKYTAFVLCVSLAVTMLSSIDVIAVKYFFDARTAGQYAGIATVAKIIFFLTASIAQVMLPSVKLNNPTKQNRTFLAKSFGLLAILGGGTTLFFILLPHFVVATLMGKNYTAAAHLLPLLSFSLFLVSVVNLIVNYYIALRKYQITLVVAAGLAITLLLFFVHHASVQAVVQSLTLGAGSMLLLFIIWRAAQLQRVRRLL
jgi:O-antigen/teichoic acid export membrane protein